MAKIIAIIGGTGAQGIPIVNALASANYKVRLLTRNPTSKHAKSLGALPNVTVHAGQYTFDGAHGAFVNTDGFSLGERDELFLGFRIFELAAEARLRHYIWGSLDYSLKEGRYDPAFRCGHYDGKGRIAEWILAQKGDMVASVLTSGP
ncbi:hypothetical protein HDU96_007571 [Phlyctochytrium bullatum]|nr:hypothetical protein HDU96_007571 [Phlyctochytrium bullatum]